jgi:flagellin-like protein
LKAISPVVATILLIGITVAAVVGVWLLTQRSARTGSVVKVDVIGIQANAAPDAKSCSFVVDLRNSGNVPVTIKKVEVSVGTGTSTVKTTLDPQDLQLSPGSTAEFTGEGTSSNPVFTDGKTAKVTITYTGPDGQDRTIIEYATIRQSTY